MAAPITVNIDGKNYTSEQLNEKFPPLTQDEVQTPKKPGVFRRMAHGFKSFFTGDKVDENDPYQKYLDAKAAIQPVTDPPTPPEEGRLPSLGKRIISMVKFIFTLGIVRDETYQEMYKHRKQQRNYNKALEKWIRRQKKRARAIQRFQKRLEANKAEPIKATEPEKKATEKERSNEAEMQKQATAEKQGPDMQQEQPQKETVATESAKEAENKEPMAQSPQAEQPKAEQPKAEQPKAEPTEAKSPEQNKDILTARSRLERVDSQLTARGKIPENAKNMLAGKHFADSPADRRRMSSLTLGLLSDASVQKKCLGSEQDISPEAAAANFDEVVTSVLTGTPVSDKLQPMLERVSDMAKDMMNQPEPRAQLSVVAQGIKAMNRYNLAPKAPGGGALTGEMVQNLQSITGQCKQLGISSKNISFNRQDYQTARADTALENLRLESLRSQKTIFSAVVNGGEELQNLKEDKTKLRELTGKVMNDGIVHSLMSGQPNAQAKLDLKHALIGKGKDLKPLTDELAGTTSAHFERLVNMGPEKLAKNVLSSNKALGQHAWQIALEYDAASKTQNNPQAQRQHSKSIHEPNKESQPQRPQARTMEPPKSQPKGRAMGQ